MIQRDWLKEAYEIAHGKREPRGIKKEHILAVVGQVKAFENSFKVLEDRMQALYNREITARKAAGLPPPPAPPSLKPEALKS